MPNLNSYWDLRFGQLVLPCRGGNISLAMIQHLCKKARKWLKQIVLSKLGRKVISLKSGAASAISMSDTEIFITKLNLKTHTEGIYDVIDDFATSYYYLDRNVQLTQVNILKTPEKNRRMPIGMESRPPTLPRKNSRSFPPARPPAHPCQIKCHCVTSL